MFEMMCFVLKGPLRAAAATPVISILVWSLCLQLLAGVQGSPVSTAAIPESLLGNATSGRSTSLTGRASTINVMIVGDSITQGHEGDWTWRYRLWEWFVDQGIDVTCKLFQFLHMATFSWHRNILRNYKKETLVCRTTEYSSFAKS